MNRFLSSSIRFQFGDVCESIVDSLLCNGPQTLLQLVDSTSRSLPLCKRALLTLIQHDCVNATLTQIAKKPLQPTPTDSSSTSSSSSTAKPNKTKSQVIVRCVYSVDSSIISYRPLFPQYIHRVKSLYGLEGEFLIQSLTQHGRLTATQLIDLSHTAYLDRINRNEQQREVGMRQQSIEVEGVRKKLETVLKEVVSANYIKRANTLVPSSSSHSGGGGMGNGEAPPPLTNAASLAVLADAEAAATPSNSNTTETTAGGKKTLSKRKRKSAEDDDGGGGGGEGRTGGGKVAATAASKSKKKVKKTAKELAGEAEEANESVAATTSQLSSLDATALSSSASSSSLFDDVLWTLNHEQFLSDFRSSFVVDYVADRINVDAAALVQVMLTTYPISLTRKGQPIEKERLIELVEEEQRKHKRNKTTITNGTSTNMNGNHKNNNGSTSNGNSLSSSSSSSSSISSALSLSLSTLDLSPSSLDSYLDDLLSDESDLLESLETGYSLNLLQLVSFVRLRHIQSVCRERYGQLGGRIFKLLTVHKRLEETQVAEMCTAHKKQTRETLFSMWKGGWIHCQEVPRTADRMPTRTFFLYGIQKNRVLVQMKEAILNGWTNIRCRMDADYKEIKPLLDKIETKKPITDIQMQQVKKWKKGNDRMEAALIQLNQLICLFLHFPPTIHT